MCRVFRRAIDVEKVLTAERPPLVKSKTATLAPLRGRLAIVFAHGRAF
jgi:hypothetical protein